MMMMKVGFIIVTLLMISGEITTEEVSPALSPTEHSSSPLQPGTEMSPSPAMSYPSEAISTDITRTGGNKASGGKKAEIVVGAIAAASMAGVVGAYVLKKRRENIRRSRYGYAATEFF